MLGKDLVFHAEQAEALLDFRGGVADSLVVLEHVQGTTLDLLVAIDPPELAALGTEIVGDGLGVRTLEQFLIVHQNKLF